MLDRYNLAIAFTVLATVAAIAGLIVYLIDSRRDRQVECIEAGNDPRWCLEAIDG